jgi:hypothetical protein
MAKEVAAANPNALPAYLQGKQKEHKVGNIDHTDKIVPRVKLLQAISPEVEEFEDAKAGIFWHSVASEGMGSELLGVPVLLRKTYVLWSPRNDDRGILARAVDGLHWDNAGMEFTVKPKNSPHNVTYKLGKTVHEVTQEGSPALSEFGSSIPGDPNSPPAAALTYEMLWLFPEFKLLSPAIIINTRSSVKPAKGLINKIDIRPVDHFYQQYKITITKEQGDEGPYFNYKYLPAGYADEETGSYAKELYETFSKIEFRANDESEEVEKEGRGAAPRSPGKGKVDDEIPF